MLLKLILRQNFDNNFKTIDYNISHAVMSTYLFLESLIFKLNKL